STIVVFRNDILKLMTGLFQFRWNEETRYIVKIVVSMIPVGILGLFFRDFIASIFDNSQYIVLIVGFMLLITATLLSFTYYAKRKGKEISFGHAFMIGIAQAVAVLPGLSRSGATIATGLLFGLKRENVARFAFLMVIIPIIGEIMLDLFKGKFTVEISRSMLLPLAAGFIAAFISGLIACRWMINIVKRGKLIYFAIYCFLIGIVSITMFLFNRMA
ncbi:MAG: undecaprenyl-diphosphate phosphatase, partial [Bacteroidetes bacterium]|nr:undecaprenyl-diphosphate phosphatase [Bacteroidota bacterium]